MAITAIKVDRDGNVNRLKFMTVQTPDHLDVDIFQCDEDFKPTGNPAEGMDLKLEEDYHRQLRIEAIHRNQFVPEESTNPEWNPNEE